MGTQQTWYYKKKKNEFYPLKELQSGVYIGFTARTNALKLGNSETVEMNMSVAPGKLAMDMLLSEICMVKLSDPYYSIFIPLKMG